MTAVIRGIILLACAAICTSRAIDGHCRCLRTSNLVSTKLIHVVRSYDPRPYCNKKEVIVTLKDKTEVCLNPDGEFTKAVLATWRMQMTHLAAKKKRTTTPTTPTGSTSPPPTSTRSS